MEDISITEKRARLTSIVDTLQEQIDRAKEQLKELGDPPKESKKAK